MKLWPFTRGEATSTPTPGGVTVSWGELGPDRLAFGLQGAEALLEDVANFSGAKVSRRDALRATAILRARNLIAGVPATLPIELRDVKTREIDDRNWLGEQPHPELETTVMMALTFEDLLFEGKSYWRITRRLGDGFPVEAYRIDPKAVSQSFTRGLPSQMISEDLVFAPGDPVTVDGLSLGSREVIRFTSPNPPLLVHAAKAIRTVLLLDQIVSDYATDPLPFGYFTDATDEEPMDDVEVNEVLGKWEGARRTRRWGYIGSGLELHNLEWPNPEQLQLAEARNHAVLEISRATGLDPSDLGTAIEGTSRTYQNAEQRRLDLIDFVLMPYISAVQDRFSMNDVCPRGLRAHFDIAAFARADFKNRMESYAKGIESDVLDHNEARRREGWPDRKATPKPVPPMIPGVPPPNGNGNGATVASNGNGAEEGVSSNGR